MRRAHRAKEEAASSEGRREQRPRSAGRTELLGTVLVVDDNIDARELYSDALVQGGFAVEVASDGLQALELARRNPPDVVVTDLEMPNMDGYALIEHLRGIASTREAYIFVLSAFSDGASRDRAVGAGCDEYAMKPYLPTTLAGRVRAIVEARDVLVRPPWIRECLW